MRLALVGLTLVSLVGCRPISQAALIPAVLLSVLPLEDESDAEPPVDEARPAPALRVATCNPATGVNCPAPPTVTCPNAVQFAAGSSTTLRATATGQGVRVRWSLAHGASQNSARFASRFEGSEGFLPMNEGLEVPFSSVIVGEYAVRAQATDSYGRTAECSSTVTATSHGLRVELSWDTRGTDLDLHMTSSDQPRWFTQSDCYFAARRPDEQLTDTPADRRRWLDTDDVDGLGPENIRVDSPDPTRTYRIGVHFYSAHGHHERTTSTVLVYCGASLAGRFARPISAERSSSENDFWEVASVRFDGRGACSLDATDRIVPASSISRSR